MSETTNLERDLWELDRLIHRISQYRSDLLGQQSPEIDRQALRMNTLASIASAGRKDAA